MLVYALNRLQPHYVSTRAGEIITGLSLATVARPIGAAVERGLIEADPAVLKPTSLGRRFLNDLQQMFLP